MKRKITTINNKILVTGGAESTLLPHEILVEQKDGIVSLKEIVNGKIKEITGSGNGGNNDAPSGNNIIKFTVNGEEYTAEEGMTWMDFCQSAYNKYDWTCEGPTDSVWTWEDYTDEWNYDYFWLIYNGDSVVGSDTIIPDGNYEEYEDSFHLGGGE